MRKIKILILVMAAVLLMGCKKENPQSIVTVTLWHVYGAQTESPMNDMIDKFNDTVGKKENIRVKVTSITNNNTIHENILSSAYQDPGAAELPDMFVSYPKTVQAMPDEEALVDYKDYFTEEELGEFVPEFLEEGNIDHKQRIIPVAKSTELLFLNKRAFDRFAAETGCTREELSTWEGLYQMAEKYYQWTDEKTPEIEGDGKMFFALDSHFNYFQVGMDSIGESFFKEENPDWENEAFQTVWDPYASAALKGAMWLGEGYATEPFQTGDAVVCEGSSASILYFPDQVTYEDNTTEELEIECLPFPVFEEGEKTVIQRGAGICTVKSTPEKEEACITFLKWITEEKNNVELVVDLGYMPVLKSAFDHELEQAVEELKDPEYVSLYQSYLKIQEEYKFYIPPKIASYLELEKDFENQIRLTLAKEREAYESEETDVNLVWEEFKENMQ